jgi:hypothetical protein
VKICVRCDQPMRDNEAKAVPKMSPSGPGMTLYLHKVPCKPAPHQSAPARRG